MEDKKIKCYNCSKEYTEDELTEQDDNLYCSDCFSELFFECNNCSTICNIENAKHDDRDNLICEDCFDNNFIECYSCNKIIRQDNANNTSDGDSLCIECFNENYFVCDDCGDTYHTDNYAQDGYCENCYNNNHNNGEDGEEVLPELNKYCKIAKNLKNCHQLPVGVEIEAEKGNYCDTFADLTALNCGLGITHDGSLDNTGIEIQTAPAKITKLAKILPAICSTLKANNYEATTKTGLHIHIGLNGSTDKQIINIIKTFACFEDVIFKLVAPSRRDNHYCEALPTPLQYPTIKNKRELNYFLRNYYAKGNKREAEQYRKDKTDLKNCYKNEKYHSARYFGFNLHSFIYRNTLEFRYHQGTINPSKIINWVKFLMAIINWARFSYTADCLEYIYSLNDNPRLKLQAILRTTETPKATRKNILDRFDKFNQK